MAERAANRQRNPATAHRRSWPWVLLSGLAAAAIVVFVVLPRYGADVPAMLGWSSSSTAAPASAALPHSATSAVAGSIPSTAAPPPGPTEIRPETLEKPAAAPAGVKPAPDDSAVASASAAGPASPGPLRRRVLRLHRRQRWTIASSRSARHSIRPRPRSMRAVPACGEARISRPRNRAPPNRSVRMTPGA